MGHLYFIRQAFSQINRNKGMSFTSIISIVATLLVLSVFLTVTININIFIKAVEKNYNMVEVFLDEDATKTDLESIKEIAKNSDEVLKIDYKTKQQALESMKKSWGESGYLLESIGENPLPDSFIITTKGVLKDNTIISALEKNNGVESVRYYKEIANKILKVTKAVQYISLAIMFVLFLASIVIVSNTIKLTVLARAKEIAIMKYIGATDWFIKAPFLIEGIIIGVFSSLLCSGITYTIYYKLVEVFNDNTISMLSVSLYPANELGLVCLITFVIIGIFVGGLGSIMSMRKFLNK